VSPTAATWPTKKFAPELGLGRNFVTGYNDHGIRVSIRNQ
jgi:hypothetical protein